MRGMTALLATLASACSFDAAGGAGAPIDAAAGGDGAPSVIDATPGTPDAGGEPVACTEGGDPCPLACAHSEALDGDFCTVPSNIPDDVALACGAGAPPLEPAAGGVIVEDVGGIRIRCTDSCDGADLETIAPAATVAQPDGGPLAVFCLSSIDIPGGVTVKVQPGLTSAIALLVDGDVEIAGPITLDGGAASAGTGVAGTGGGLPGAGGGAGASLSDLAGGPGGGACGGSGGARVGVTGDHAAGGGGGGGYIGLGGKGGQGVDAATTTSAMGGDPGGPDCGGADLRPLRGGGGGGGGGDGSCGNNCGWAGGGGGGALQISARGTMLVDDVIQATGGAGYGSVASMNGNGGGGGGGAGGAILLEAQEITLGGQGDVTVNGGAGGVSGGGTGGQGAGGTAIDGQEGKDGTTASQGGSGGGGAAGRVRLNAVTGGVCSGAVSPDGACAAGSLRLQLTF